MKKFLLSAAITATLISSVAFAESAFDGIPSEAVQATELDAVSGKAAKPITPLTIKAPSYVGTSTPARLNNAFGSVEEMNALSNASKNYGDLTKIGNNYVTTNSLNSKQPVTVYTTPAVSTKKTCYSSYVTALKRSIQVCG